MKCRARTKYINHVNKSKSVQLTYGKDFQIGS